MRYWSALVLALALGGCQEGFGEQHVKEVQAEIEKAYTNKEKLSSVQATLVRDGKRKMTGFVKLEGVDGSKATLSCTATMDESDRNYIWQCNR